MGAEEVNIVNLKIEGEIGEEGWSAIRRAVEHLSEAGVSQIGVRTRRTAMRAVRMYTRLMSKMMVESGKIPWK